MVRNESSLDRGMRVLEGLVLVSLVLIGPRSAWGWLGLLPLVTGLVGWCPLYSLLGVSTLAPRRPLSWARHAS